MTLVTSNEDRSTFSMMLNVQQQQQHHLHMHRHQVAYQSSQVHRGNVIVATGGGVSPVENKMIQQQTGPQHCKRSKVYTQTTPYGTLPHQPASVARRNARERNRVKQVNNGFAELRERIPQSIAQALSGSSSQQHSGSSRAGSKKLSKVETLRMAVEYIRSLQRLLDEHDGTGSTNPSSSMSSSSSTCGSVLLSEPDLGVEMRLNTSADLDHQHYHHHHHMRQDASPTAFTLTACSEASSSPTPSFVSEASSGGSQGFGPTNTATYIHDYNEYYSDSNTPKFEDEELLDCISLWQESQS